MKPAIPTTVLKLSALYRQPQNSAAYEAYFLGTHMPLVAAAPAPARAEASLDCLGPTDLRHRYTGCSKLGSTALSTWLRVRVIPSGKRLWPMCPSSPQVA